MPYSPTPIINSGNSPDMGLLERHDSRLKCQQERLMFFDESVVMDDVFSDSNGDRGLGELLMGAAVKPDPGMETGVCALPRTVSFPPSKAARGISAVEEPLLSYAASAVERGSSKKRKADKNQNLKITATEKSSEGKKKKVCKLTEQNSSSKSTTTTVTNNKNSTGPSPNAKESSNSKGAENPKPDYIHVRARRGQATDSHSLAERVRREKISERMKFLQDLVPGCNTITGKAGMLDEIINYVQSLQRQVEFLSMKLAAVDTRLDFDADSYLVNENFCPMYRPCTPGLPEVGASSNVLGPAMVQFENFGPNSGLEMVANPMDQAFLDSPSSLNIQQLTWGDELQNLYTMDYQQGRFTSPAQPFTGVVLGAGHVKMEM